MKSLLDKPAEALAELRRLHAQEPLPQLDSQIAAWAAYFDDPAFALEILSGRTTSSATEGGSLLRIP
mgnify:CR=1 FL=1